MAASCLGENPLLPPEGSGRAFQHTSVPEAPNRLLAHVERLLFLLLQVFMASGGMTWLVVLPRPCISESRWKGFGGTAQYLTHMGECLFSFTLEDLGRAFHLWWSLETNQLFLGPGSSRWSQSSPLGAAPWTGLQRALQPPD